MHLFFQVLVATMAATATVGHGRHVDLSYMSEEYGHGYGHGYDAVPTDTYYRDYYNDYHSLHKRSPVSVPFLGFIKPFNPFIAIPTKGKSIPFQKPTNKAFCLFTFCSNKKTGLMI